MYLGNKPALNYTSLAKQDFTTSATTTYTLDNPVANANELALFINNVRQEPTTAYSASSTTLTLTEATSATDTMYAVFLGKAVQTVNPPNNSVNESQLSYPLTNFSSTGIDDNATANALTIDSSSNLQFNSGYGSVATAYGCRAWVNFNGTGTVAIRDSGNVSSITDNGGGKYTVNFTTALADTNYCMVSAPSHTNNTDGSVFSVRSYDGTISTSSIEILTAYSNTGSNGFLDMTSINVAIFR